ncbi:MAG: DUF3592 domain-containing protein [Chitinophagaceae bacterium]|nr:DUF3592 domain-containing protein [Chitinophagaceae bacterium]
MIFVYTFIIGLPCLLIYFITRKMQQAKYIQQHGIKTNAVVTNVVTQRHSKGTTDLVSMQYKDLATGQLYPAKASTQQNQYRPGDSMPLSYLPANPAKYSFDKGQRYWFVLVFCILLLLFMIFAAYKINEMGQGSNLHFSP